MSLDNLVLSRQYIAQMHQSEHIHERGWNKFTKFDQYV